MATATKANKVKVSAKSLLDSPAINSVSAWALLVDGKHAGKIVWTIGSGGMWKCTVIVYNQYGSLFGLDLDEVSALNSMVIGSAGGYGYDKRSAAFVDCLHRNGLTVPFHGGAGSGAIHTYLTGLCFQVIEVI